MQRTRDENSSDGRCAALPSRAESGRFTRSALLSRRNRARYRITAIPLREKLFATGSSATEPGKVPGCPDLGCRLTHVGGRFRERKSSLGACLRTLRIYIPATFLVRDVSTRDSSTTSGQK